MSVTLKLLLLLSSFLLASLELSDTKVYEPEIRALLGTASHFCEVVVLELRLKPSGVAGRVLAQGRLYILTEHSDAQAGNQKYTLLPKVDLPKVDPATSPK